MLLTGGDVVPDGGRMQVAEIVGHEHREILAESFSDIVSKNALSGGVDREYLAFVVDHDDGVFKRFNDGAVTLFALVQGFLGTLTSSDIPRDAQDSHDGSGFQEGSRHHFAGEIFTRF